VGDFDKVQTLFGNPLFELKRGSAGLRVDIQLVKSTVVLGFDLILLSTFSDFENL